MNKGLIAVPRAVKGGGKEGISTRKLLRKIGMIGYGGELIKRAEALQYIRCEARDPDSQRVPS